MRKAGTDGCCPSRDGAGAVDVSVVGGRARRRVTTTPPVHDAHGRLVAWQVIKLRGRMGGILNLLNGMFGGGGNIVEKADVAVEKLQGYKERMVSLRTHVFGLLVVLPLFFFRRICGKLWLFVSASLPVCKNASPLARFTCSIGLLRRRRFGCCHDTTGRSGNLPRTKQIMLRLRISPPWVVVWEAPEVLGVWSMVARKSGGYTCSPLLSHSGGRGCMRRNIGDDGDSEEEAGHRCETRTPAAVRFVAASWCVLFLFISRKHVSTHVGPFSFRWS